MHLIAACPYDVLWRDSLDEILRAHPHRFKPPVPIFFAKKQSSGCPFFVVQVSCVFLLIQETPAQILVLLNDG